MTNAVVLGGGLAGILAAVALAGRCDNVTIIERDELPDEPRPRRGIPQGHHSHMLMRGGAESFDDLLPGTTDKLFAAGAKKRGLPFGALARGPGGWLERLDTDGYVLSASRDVLDHIVRQQALSNTKLSVVESTKVVGLTGDAGRVTGARIERDGGEETTIEADVVVDATGRRSHAPRWLTELGLPETPEEFVDAGVAYSSRWLKAPSNARDDFPGVMIQAQPGKGTPGCGAGLLPAEDGKWILSLFGSRGGQPPTDEEGFADFARNKAHPIIGDLLAQAEPLGPIRGYKAIPDRQRRFEKMSMPEGFIVIGDAASALNPIHGTGMSAAALCARALRDELNKSGAVPGLAKRVQAAIAKINANTWQVAVGADQGFPDVKTNVKLQTSAMQQRLAARLGRVACHNATVANAVFSVSSLIAPPSKLVSPPVLWAALRGPRRGPLSFDEAVAQYPEFGDLLTATKASDPA